MSLRSPSRQLTTNQPLQRLLAYNSNYRKLLWLATICSVLNKLFDLAPPALIGIAVLDDLPKDVNPQQLVERKPLRQPRKKR